MILKISCPACNKAYRLSPPYPPSGKRYRCTCQKVITVTYPPELARMLETTPTGYDPDTAPAPPPDVWDADPPVAEPAGASSNPGPAQRVQPPPHNSPQPTDAAGPAPAAPSRNPTPAGASGLRTPRSTGSPTEPAAHARSGGVRPPPPPEDPPGRGNDGPAAPPPRRRRRARLLLALFGALMLFGAGSAAGIIWYYSRDLPGLDSLKTYRPAIPTQVYAADGRLIGEFYGEERRYVLPYDKIPKRVIEAFLSAEDAGFFEHHGIDYVGIARAMLTNLREQRMAQGASTITQQVARSFLLTREKKLERKIVEALLAYRIENSFPKEHILYLYLNQIYLGEGAYGVQAAARTYFHKDVDQLSLAETALIAGLCPAPSRYSPLDHFKEAIERQHYVLNSMVRDGHLTEEEAEAARQEVLDLKPRSDLNKKVAPFVTEHIRRYLATKYGDSQVLTGGLQVYTTIDYDLQQIAQKAVYDGVREIDHRIGFRGPEKNISPEEIPAFTAAYEKTWLQEQQSARPGGVDRWGPPPAGPMKLEVDGVYKGVALEVKDKYARVQVGSQEGLLPLENIPWAYPVNPERNWKYRTLDKVTRVLKAGDVFTVRVTALTAKAAQKLLGRPADKLVELTLEQVPEVEGSLFSYNVVDGSVIAMVGGYDYSRSEFNRPMQARRQVGSAFKPLVYAAALDNPDKVYTPATILLDAPITMHKDIEDPKDPAMKELWKPSNYDRDYLGEIMLRKALYLSRNTVAVKVLSEIGVDYAYEYVKRFAIESPINKDTSMVLGTSSITLFEMCRAYSAFASGGALVEPVFVNRVIDRDGKVLEERPKEPVRTQAMPASTAYLMTTMLQDVVRMGTATKALELRKPTAGKTGTTNDFVDASYFGYTPQLVTGTWIGYDQPRSLGYGETGGDAALPMWVEYMKEALKVYPKTDFPVPEDVVFATVDEQTGKLANEGTEHKIRIPFKKGQEPVETAPEPGQVGVEDFLSADGGL